MDRDCVFAIDFTHESMTAAFVTFDGEERESADFGLEDFTAGGAPPFDKFLGLLIAKTRAAGGCMKAAAISVPCGLDRGRRTIAGFPEAPWLEGQSVPEILEKAFGLPVIMERRAVSRLAFDRIMLGLPEESLIFGCYVDTHFDAAIWDAGAPVLGKNGLAGSVGHMTIHDREDTCFCGKKGCADLYGAGLRLRQMHQMIFPDTPLAEIFVRHGEHPIVQDYLSMMAYPIAIAANILDPDYLIVGGAIPAMRGFPMKLLEENILRHRCQPAADQTGAVLASAAGSVPGTAVIARYAIDQLGLA